MPFYTRLSVYTDGGSRGNPGTAAIGILILDPQKNTLFENAKRIGIATNNQAEYTALETALKHAHSFSQGTIDCYADSELLIRQLSGKYHVRNPILKKFFLRIKEQEKKFARVNYHHVKRSDTNIAYVDRLLNKALDAEN